MTKPLNEVYLDDINKMTLDIYDIIKDKWSWLDEDEDFKQVETFLKKLAGEHFVSDYRNWN